MITQHTCEDVEHCRASESGGRDGEEEREEVHQRQHGPSVEDKDQHKAALLLERDESVFVEAEEGDQDAGAGHQEIDEIPGHVGQPKGHKMDARNVLQVFGFRHAFLHYRTPKITRRHRIKYHHVIHPQNNLPKKMTKLAARKAIPNEMLNPTWKPRELLDASLLSLLKSSNGSG